MRDIWFLKFINWVYFYILSIINVERVIVNVKGGN